ncbi:MAG: LysR family transcriptional regulator [Methylotenera sp.]|nr:LysR family transcriptional regulator [Oligoflexia bacterium]
MELNHLRYFYEVARARSFTAAAKVLRVSQPSISKIIRILEDREGVKLFDRHKKGVTLTPQGEFFYSSCSKVFAELENLHMTLKLQKTECEGDLSLGASDNVCNYLLPHLIPGFWKKYPKVHFNVLSATSECVKEDLQSGKCELGLFYTKPEAQFYESRKIGPVEFVIVCSTENEKFRNTSVLTQALASESYYLGSRLQDYQGPYPALKRLNALGIQPRLFFETNSQETQKKMALQRLGYTVLPHFMVREELKQKKLKLLQVNAPGGKLPESNRMSLYLVKKKGKTLSKPAQLMELELLEKLPELL